MLKKLIKSLLQRIGLRRYDDCVRSEFVNLKVFEQKIRLYRQRGTTNGKCEIAWSYRWS